MTQGCWDFRNSAEAWDDSFAGRWRDRLSHAPRAHFEFDPDCLRWQARHGATTWAVLIDGPGPGLAMLLGVTPRESRSGAPWRWNVVAESAGAADESFALRADEAARAVAAARALSGGRRLLIHLPASACPDGIRAGATCVNVLDPDTDRMLRALDDAKRRAIRKATRAGYEVKVADTSEQFRAFAELQRLTEARRGNARPETPAYVEPGEAWREWELPWMWLLVAERDGRVEAGSGFGRLSGGSLDYRTNASSDDARKAGANVLLAWEGMRRGALDGHRWLNWCGATRFKRELGGTVIPVRCHLDGDLRWALPNQLARSWHGARPWMARLAKRLGARRGVAS